jgi:hypothetical protein
MHSSNNSILAHARQDMITATSKARLCETCAKAQPAYVYYQRQKMGYSTTSPSVLELAKSFADAAEHK